ncbi:hypothetical protein C7I55_01385 [Sphingomonas deserti]|uniref:Xyloglucanase n=1 Tax=Allosphingosinicella deserti TaxID=2116704 RepID=A0A2P7R071_9SPHN|nr:hypothetical protein C7I55_01385 [Sphingomonas deserti]
MLWLIGAAAIVVAAPAASAEPASTPYRWRNVKVGAGGFAPNLVFSHAEKGLAYLRTDMGGAYRWDDAARHWIPLQDGNAVGSYMGVESIAADPTNPEKVYLAAGMSYWGEAAIWRSADRGKSWDIVPVPFKMGGNEDGRGLGERLAIDPNQRSTLFFGSRHDGLWRSANSGRTWAKVESFPHPGLGAPEARRQTHAGVSFVVFDPASSTIFAGVADPTRAGVYRSDDGGQSWRTAEASAGPEMLPVKADLAHRTLYVAYATGIGPNGIAGGAVRALDLRHGTWRDITPDRGASAEGGYMGLSADRQRPGRVAVSSVDRWQAGDTIWVSDDDGRHWQSLQERSRRDISDAPWLAWGHEEAEFGHWTAGLAIDPFDSGTLAYTTGATVYRTREGTKPAGTMTWQPWIDGIEQTAVITLISPTAGAPLISGFGDLAGFVHDRLDVAPATMHLVPRLTNTNNLDYAGLKPDVVVRSGTLHAEQPQGGASLGYSEDGGRTWRALRVPALDVGHEPSRRYDLRGDAPIDVSADGATFIVGTPIAMVTHDRGRTWAAAKGLPLGARAIADKADRRLFYAIDFDGGRIYVSRDGGRSFAPAAAHGLPADISKARTRGREDPWPMVAVPGRAGALWFNLGGRLWRSEDHAGHFRLASGADIAIEGFGLGRGADGSDVPAVYAVGTRAGLRAIWRSLDGGTQWTRVNDDSHQWGLRFRTVSGDPRVFGRVYVATDGRGIIWGEPAEARRK